MTKQDTYLKNALEGFEEINVAAELKEKALANLEAWLTSEQHSDACPQLEILLDHQNFAALFDAFFQQIPFGTGGRRGPVGFGTNRINPHTISTSIQGHCDFLAKHRGTDDGQQQLSVVVAYDVRVFQDLRGNYDASIPNALIGMSSRDFAVIAARVYAANGIVVWFNHPDSETFISTPELSFAIRSLSADAGLNISASHNHPDDNGAKIYNARGAQEIPPLDEEMATMVEAIDIARTMAWDEAVEKNLIRWISPEIHDEYIATNVALSLKPKARSARIVFTPLHGTGWSSVGATLESAGFDVECYAGQAEPDGSFPNVPFRSPNPEVRESLSAATQYAEEKGADLVLAADPDADRLGMVAPDRDGRWTFLNGNQIGTVLAAFLMGERAGKVSENGFAVTTVVTTSLFGRIAESYGLKTITDLGIGFKYIANVLNTVEDGKSFDGIEGTVDDFVLGIEESHGYLVTPEMRDKDAAGAGLLLSELVSTLKDEGRTVLEYLDDTYRQFGYVCNHLVSTVMQGARGFINIRQIQEKLRTYPPTQVGNLKVERFIDRWDESGPLGRFASSTDRSSRDLLTFELEGDARIILRPSGTESKNKIYVEVASDALGPDASDDQLREQKEEVDLRAREIAQEFCLMMLDRIGVEIPRYALAVSDLVPLEWKQDFAQAFLPELLIKLSGGEKAAKLGDWVDNRLSSYGSDGRLLVKGAVAAFLESEPQAMEVRDELETIFGL